jgi:hypothetical protein
MRTLLDDMAQALRAADKNKPYSYNRAARSALTVILASLRKPSKKMIDAGYATRPTEECWRVMLDQWTKEQGIDV